MKTEINSAAEFLMTLLRVRQQENSLTETQLHSFRGSVSSEMVHKFMNHWYPENKNKGSGFRCIRINGIMDPLIYRAAKNSGINSVVIRNLLPSELTLWIDPSTVCYRIGENGSICVLYDDIHRASPSDLDSTGSGSEEYRCEISPELSKLILDFNEKSNNSIIHTRPRRNQRQNFTFNNSPPRYFPHGSTFQSQSPSNNQYYQNKAY